MPASHDTVFHTTVAQQRRQTQRHSFVRTVTTKRWFEGFTGALQSWLHKNTVQEGGTGGTTCVCDLSVYSGALRDRAPRIGRNVT